MLTVENLNVWFGFDPDRVDAVRDASFTVVQAESFGLVGESGSGKSTILRAVAGLIDTWSGTIAVAGRPQSARKRDRAFFKTVQMVFQDPYASLHPRHSVDAVLSETLRLQGMDDIDRRIAHLLDDVGLGGASDSAIRTSFRGDSASAWPSPAPLPPSRACCCWMNPPVRWTSACRRKS